jgi:TPR repeat protein
VRFLSGQGVGLDRARGLAYLERAAASHVGAAYALAVERLDTDQRGEVGALLRRGAEREYPPAARLLAQLLIARRLEPLHPAEPELALRLSARLGDEGAARVLTLGPPRPDDAVGRQLRAQLRESVAAGDVEALGHMGRAHRVGRAGPVDLLSSLHFYGRGAAAGSAEGMVDFARVLRDDLLDEGSSEHWLEAAARADPSDPGYAQALQELAALHWKRRARGVPGANDELLVWSARSAEETGHAHSMTLYAEALAVSGEQEKAAQWFAKAAEAGDVPGTLRLAEWRWQGRGGLPVDRDLAARLFRRVERRGGEYASAAHMAHSKLLHGAGDFAGAYREALASAEGGRAEAMVAVGEALRQGRGARKDPAEALRWYRRAAEAGIPLGWVRMGELIAAGEGAERDPHRGLLFLERGLAEIQNPKNRNQPEYAVAELLHSGRVGKERRAEGLARMRRLANQRYGPARDYLRKAGR